MGRTIDILISICSHLPVDRGASIMLFELPIILSSNSF